MMGMTLNHLAQIDASYYARLEAAKSGEVSSSTAAAYEFLAESENGLSNMRQVLEVAMAELAARHAAEYAMTGQHVDQTV